MQQVIGFALVVLQAVLLGLLSRTVQFPVVIILVAGLGVATKWRITLSRDQAFLLSAAAAFFFLLKHRFSPHEFPTGSEFIRTQVAFIIAQFLLTVEAAQFLIRQESNRLSPVLPVLGAVALICIADVQITNEQRTMTRAFAVAYPLLWAMYLWACRNRWPLPPPRNETQNARRKQAQRRRVWSGGFVLAATAVVAWFSSLGLYEFEKTIEHWLVQWMMATPRSTRVGFDLRARLGSIAHQKSEQEDQTALWVDSVGFPGYLRGAVYTRCESSQWETPLIDRSSQQRTSSKPPAELQPPKTGESLTANPDVKSAKGAKWRYLECWLAVDLDGRAFTPLGTSYLITAGEPAGMSPGGIFLLRDFATNNPYTACIPSQFSPGTISPQEREAFLEVAADYQEPLTELAKRIVGDAKTPQEKIRAVERYFQENYRYHLGVEVPSEEDPLLYFLREKPPAHCEYFATAAALILRAAGVPTRYVTGFVPAERNTSGGYWVARNRDAHAWAEAYVESEGWVTVEATPTEGVPSADSQTALQAFWDAIRSDWARLRVFLSQQHWKRAWNTVWRGWLKYPLGFGFLVLGLYFGRRFRGRWRIRRGTHAAADPRLAEMRKLLEKMDRQLKPHGLKRDSAETLHQFARRIKTWDAWRLPSRNAPPTAAQDMQRFADRAGDWYLVYADCCYQGEWDSQTLESLRSSFPRS